MTWWQGRATTRKRAVSIWVSAYSTPPLVALKPIQRMPSVRSPRLGLLCEIPGLRSRRVTDFPLQRLYFEAEDHLDVARLLGDRQDIAAIMGSDE
jgi:toxin ParE1/3/4